MTKEIYINENIRFFSVKGIPIIANLDNASIIGMSEQGEQFWKNIWKNHLVEDDERNDNIELYNRLVEFDMISETPRKKRKKNKLNLASAYLHVTNRCNLHCLGCYSKEDRKRKVLKEPTTEELKIALCRLGKAGVRSLVISGGEPFLRKDLYEILRYGKEESGIEHILVITNGTITEDYSIFKNVIDHISISIDGFNEEHPTFIRDQGIFDKTLNAVNNFKSLGFEVGILPTLHKKNIHYMDQYKKLSEELGVGLSYSLLSVCDTPEFHDFIPGQEELRLLSQNLLESGDRVQDMGISAELQAGLTCGAGKTIISISADGAIYPCHMLHVPELEIGNIFIHPLEDRFLNMEIIDRFQRSTVESNKGCRQCEYKYFCSGGCRARAYYKDNDIQGKDSYCEHSRYFYEKVIDDLLARINNDRKE